MLVGSAWTGPQVPVCKLALAGTPAQPRFAPLQEKKYQARRLGGPRRDDRSVGHFNVCHCGNIYYIFDFLV